MTGVKVILVCFAEIGYMLITDTLYSMLISVCSGRPVQWQRIRYLAAVGVPSLGNLLSQSRKWYVCSC